MDGRAAAALLDCPAGGADADKSPVHGRIDRLVAAIDRTLSDQVNAIIHHPRFQRLEAGWRSLSRLVEVAAGVRGAKIRLLSVAWPEICRDIDRAAEFDQSTLFARIYSDEFGTPGGEPLGLLIGDYEVEHRRRDGHPTDDVAALSALAGVAAAAFAPLIVGAGPALLGLDRFADLAPMVDLAGAFRGEDHVRWARLQEQEDARFLGVVLPRVLVRPPYADDGSRRDGFRFREAATHARDASLWGNAGYAFAAVVLRAFGQHGWLADIRGARLDADGGGLVTHLPRSDFRTDAAGVAPRFPLDVSLTERQERALSEQGLIPLVRARETPFLLFNTCQSLQQPRRPDTAAARAGAAAANARLSALLSAILCVGRFAHYLKVMARDRIGGVTTPEACQTWLQEWLRGYVMGNDDASAEMKARYPLRDARVEVVEPPGQPGRYDCVVHLQPHFQFEQALSTFRLTTQIIPGQRR
jgi:type VI secretion system protein ImpD